MVKKIIEYESSSCDIRYENDVTIERISETMEAIEKYFYNMEFTVQQYKDNILQGEYIMKSANCNLKSITVDLDTASDEFILGLETPVVVQEFSNKLQDTKDMYVRQDIKRDYLTVEVVVEGIAEDNDMDFLGHSKYNELVSKGEYKLGEINSYYKTLGTIKRTTGESTYYYREL